MMWPSLCAGTEAIARRLAPHVGGRSLALVGNARSLCGSSLGREIDSCGLVIRLNSAPGLAPPSHGARTDWLATSIAIPAKRLLSLAPEQLMWMSPRRRLLAAAAYGWRVPLAFYPGGWWRELAGVLGARPSTGLMAIDLLTRLGGFTELRLYGFDFFRSGSLSLRRLAAPPPHDFTREHRHVLALRDGGAAITIVTGGAAS